MCWFCPRRQYRLLVLVWYDLGFEFCAVLGGDPKASVLCVAGVGIGDLPIIDAVERVEFWIVVPLECHTAFV